MPVFNGVHGERLLVLERLPYTRYVYRTLTSTTYVALPCAAQTLLSYLKYNIPRVI
jgi:hypothetical protein